MIRLAALGLAGCLAQSQAGLLFEESFEKDLSAWTWAEDEGRPTTAVISRDPLQSDHALRFSALVSNGDLFTNAAFSGAPGNCRLSFEYLGMPAKGGVPGDLGGFLGYAYGLPGGHGWLAGTSPAYASMDVLIDDGKWHPVNLPFDIGAEVHLMLEDWAGSAGVAGDAYFDNIRLNCPDADETQASLR